VFVLFVGHQQGSDSSFVCDMLPDSTVTLVIFETMETERKS